MSDPNPPDQVGGFTVGESIGAGSGSIVYDAKDESGTRVAFKVIRRVAMADDARLRRFKNQLKLLESVAHPNVISVLGSGELEDGRPWFAMPFLSGSLADRIGTDKTFNVLAAIELVFELLAGLQRVHAAGVVHRDIRPVNVLFGTDDRPIIADFGVARMNPDEGESIITQVGDDIGGVGYAAGELRGDPHNVGPEVDVYSVGCVLFVLMTGRSALDLEFATQNQNVMRGVPALVRPTLLKATAYQSKDRYQSAREFAIELASVYDKCAEQADKPQNGADWMLRFDKEAPKEIPDFEDPRTVQPATTSMMAAVGPNPIVMGVIGFVIVAVIGGAGLALAFGMITL